MDYSKLSDGDINYAVANALGSNTAKTYSGEVLVVKCRVWARFDPCNNPMDAFPIIVENSIGFTPPIHDEKWEAMTFDRGGYVHKNEYDKNPLRAAMIVFLMMQ